jgi:hypothetical protein
VCSTPCSSSTLPLIFHDGDRKCAISRCHCADIVHPPVCLPGNCGVRAWGQARCKGVVPQGASARQSHERAAPPGEPDVLVCRVCLFDSLFVCLSSLDLRELIGMLSGFHVRKGSIWLVSSLCNKRARTRTRTRARTHTHTHTHTHTFSLTFTTCVYGSTSGR